MRERQDITEAVNRYADTVLRTCSVYLAPPEHEDAFQETFLRYARHEGEFESEEHRKAWLIRVAVNVCKDMLRAAYRKDEPLDDNLPEVAFQHAQSGDARDLGNPDLADGQSRHATLMRALGALDEKYRVALYLKYYEGMSAAQIARLTGTPEATVYTNLSRGRKKLKEVLTHG